MNDRDNNVAALRRALASERAAVEYFEARRWGDHPACPRCGTIRVRQTRGSDGRREKAMRWWCSDCSRHFSVRTGTTFEESRLPMRVWAHGFWRCCASKKGVSALQIKRECGIGYRAALFMMNRIRFGMAGSPDAPRLSGTVEADETFVGGKPRRRNYERTGSKGLKPGPKGNLAPVVAVVQRGGDVRMRHLPNVTGDNLHRFLAKNVRESARLVTDEHPLYITPGKRFVGGHDTVNHAIREYARGDVNTNSVEGVFALLKRGIYGTFHAVSQEHLHRYLAEFEFRYNARKVDDAERVALAIKANEGKRLYYREQGSRGQAA